MEFIDLCNLKTEAERKRDKDRAVCRIEMKDSSISIFTRLYLKDSKADFLVILHQFFS